MNSPICVITGSSRGIGAATALEMARRGCDLVVTYHSKLSRAQEVAAQIEALGQRCLCVGADLTDSVQLAAMADQIKAFYGRVDQLILNAAGGLEREKDDNYAYALNVSANHALLDLLLPIMSDGAAVLYVTSHPSHFYGRQSVLAGYERVASTKKVAEDTLRERIPELSAHNVRLVVLSGDLIEGTINAKLMQRAYPGLMRQRSEEVGGLPTVDEFSKAIADAALKMGIPSGETILVGSVDWGTYDALHAAEQASPTDA